MTWVRYANRLEEENNGLKKLLEEALDHIDQYDYEESFDLVQRIKDSLGSKPLKAVQWGDNAVTGAEELLQKVQQLERDKVKMLADLQVESEINAKGGEREYVLLGKVEQLERENAALREQIAALGEIACLNLDDATVAKCDAVTGGEKYRDVMHRLFVEQPKELAALRNEVARLSNRTQWLCTCGGSKASA